MPDETPPLEVLIITPQYDPGKEPVFYRWMVKPGQTGVAELIGFDVKQRSTTQTDLDARVPTEIRDLLEANDFRVNWGDDELAADLVDFLATKGITATVVDPSTPEDPS